MKRVFIDRDPVVAGCSRRRRANVWEYARRLFCSCEMRPRSRDATQTVAQPPPLVQSLSNRALLPSSFLSFLDLSSNIYIYRTLFSYGSIYSREFYFWKTLASRIWQIRSTKIRIQRMRVNSIYFTHLRAHLNARK